MREAAGCLIVARDTGAVLLLRRSALVSHSGEWGIPGGGYDKADGTMERCALRETFEEAALLPKLVSPLCVQERKGRRFVTFLAVVPRQVRPIINWEHDAYVWAPMTLDGWDTPSPLYVSKDGEEQLADVLELAAEMRAG